MRVKWMGLMLSAVVAGACSNETVGAVATAERSEETAMTNEADAAGTPRRELPYAHGRSFATLDEYLAHLERYAGPVGQPWYRKIGSDLYQRVTTVRTLDGRNQPETFTREQLMREYGFTH